MGKFKAVALGICCCFLSIVFYSTSQLKLAQSDVSVKGDTESSWVNYQQYLFKNLRTSSEKESAKLAQSAHDASLQELSEASDSINSTRQEVNSKMMQAASESSIKLQYALKSNGAHLEDPHLFSMGQYVNTFTTYLEAILSDHSIDPEPFHNLRQQFFPWWSPSANVTYLPWEPRGMQETGVVVTVGQGNFIYALHCIQVLRKVVNSTIPIQVFYAGDNDLPEAKRDEMKALHPLLETIDILENQFNETIADLRGSGYAMKPFAALASSFARVILIDADTIFLQRSDDYFGEHAELNKSGLLYYHDRAFEGRKTVDWVKTLMQGAEPSTTLKESLFWRSELEHQQESGVVFFNKAIPSAFMSLLFTTYMNTQKVRNDIYTHVLGRYPNAARGLQFTSSIR